MPKVRSDAPYDPNDRESIKRYASNLKGKILGEVCDAEIFRFSFKNKGSFGSALESGYFMIDNNNEKEPDFKDLGIELKTAPMTSATKTEYRPKERMSLSNINYETILTEGIQGSLLHKNHELLVVFYLDNGEADIRDQKILGSILWKFPEEDMRIIKGDWETIADMVRRGLAHELSGRQTFYLEAATKGPGKGKGLKKQPFSDELAKPRAFALKSRYVKAIWKASKDTERMIKDISEWDEKKTFEEVVIGRFVPYQGMYFDEIESRFGIHNSSDKGRYASIARMMLGIKGKKIEEFEKADVVMKTIRLRPDGTPKESMSFPYFKYEDIIEGTWDESDFHEVLDKKFLFVIYQIDNNEDVYFKTAKFWSMPVKDMVLAEEMWLDTQKRLRGGNYDSLPRSSENKVAHVRPHAKNKADTYVGLNGHEYEKKSFWLNSSYLKEVIDKLIREERKK
ncbi:MAG: Sau3AI family type II restriction endonuclease [Candidatus Methanomethylophilaceae archaeon]